MDGRMSMLFIGSNGSEVREWVDSHPKVPEGETWFVSRAMTAPTGGQAWRYVKDEDWSSDVPAAVYDVRRGHWVPVMRGDVIERQGPGYNVLRGV